jgi:CHASE3 domain sensor protein
MNTIEEHEAEQNHFERLEAEQHIAEAKQTIVLGFYGAILVLVVSAICIYDTLSFLLAH